MPAVIGSTLLKILPGNEKVEPVWRSTALEIHWTTPIYHDGFLYAFSGRNEPDASLACVDAATGKIVWRATPEWTESIEAGGRPTQGT